MGKQLVNFITCGCEASAPFFGNLQSRAQIHTILMIGLYELLGNPTTIRSRTRQPPYFRITETDTVNMKHTCSQQIESKLISENLLIMTRMSQDYGRCRNGKGRLKQKACWESTILPAR
jgi:hypothetical protein